MTLLMGIGTGHTLRLGGGILPYVCLCAYVMAQLFLFAGHEPHHHGDDSLFICDICVVKDTVDQFKKLGPAALVPFADFESEFLIAAASHLLTVGLRRVQPRAPPQRGTNPILI